MYRGFLCLVVCIVGFLGLPGCSSDEVVIPSNPSGLPKEPPQVMRGGERPAQER